MRAIFTEIRRQGKQNFMKIPDSAFKNLTAEQIKRFDGVFALLVDSNKIFETEPDVLRVIELVSSKEEISEKDIETVTKIIENASHVGRVKIFSEAMKSTKNWRKIHEKCVSYILSSLSEKTSRFTAYISNPREVYEGPPLAIGKTYKTLVSMPSSNNFIEKSTHFKLVDFIRIEHGCIDATVEFLNGVQQKVIMFPDEVQLI